MALCNVCLLSRSPTARSCSSGIAECVARVRSSTDLTYCSSFTKYLIIRGSRGDPALSKKMDWPLAIFITVGGYDWTMRCAPW